MSNDDGAARRRARTCVLFGRIDQHLWLQQQVYVKRFVQHDQNGDREQLVERVVVVEMGDVVISLLHDFFEPKLLDGPSAEARPPQLVHSVGAVGDKVPLARDWDQPEIGGLHRSKLTFPPRVCVI